MVEMPSGARASLTGLRADPGGHRDAAITCPQRLDATGINAGSDPEQPDAGLAAYFKQDSTQAIQDELARNRALACKEGLVARG